jgi:peptide/nickel transport system permease protein
MLYGMRISMFLGVAAVLISGAIGVVLGLVSGYYRGLVDSMLTYVFDVQQSLPMIVLAVMLAAVLGPGVWTTVLVLGVAAWILFARVVRGEVLVIREREYILASRAVGASDLRIMVFHILPNVASPIIVMASFTFSMLIIAEASLSFLGLGVQPPLPSLGNMLAAAREYMEVAPWYSIAPGVPILLVVLGANLLGDWLRDRLDPTLRNL